MTLMEVWSPASTLCLFSSFYLYSSLDASCVCVFVHVKERVRVKGKPPPLTNFWQSHDLFAELDWSHNRRLVIPIEKTHSFMLLSAFFLWAISYTQQEIRLPFRSGLLVWIYQVTKNFWLGKLEQSLNMLKEQPFSSIQRKTFSSLLGMIKCPWQHLPFSIKRTGSASFQIVGIWTAHCKISGIHWINWSMTFVILRYYFFFFDAGKAFHFHHLPPRSATCSLFLIFIDAVSSSHFPIPLNNSRH